MVVIKESNMLFGEYEDNKVFKIENSELHNKIGNGIKVVEFILLRNGKYIDFIEAKSSSPQPSNDNKERFHEFIEEISDKFIHSFKYHNRIWKSDIIVINEQLAKQYNLVV